MDNDYGITFGVDLSDNKYHFWTQIERTIFISDMTQNPRGNIFEGTLTELGDMVLANKTLKRALAQARYQLLDLQDEMARRENYTPSI
jgi:hypothetical protein